MNMFARFDRIPSMAIQDIKDTKCSRQTDDSHTDSLYSLWVGSGGGGCIGVCIYNFSADLLPVV